MAALHRGPGVLREGEGEAVAVDVQNWVFGEPPKHTLDGRWTLTRTLTTCQNLVEGCASNPVDVRFDSCSHTQCVMSRDTVWRSPHPVAHRAGNLGDSV
jgi:hypothetical protein